MWVAPSDEERQGWGKPSDEERQGWDKPSDEERLRWDKPSDKERLRWDKPSDEERLRWDKPSDEERLRWDKPSDDEKLNVSANFQLGKVYKRKRIKRIIPWVSLCREHTVFPTLSSEAIAGIDWCFFAKCLFIIYIKCQSPCFNGVVVI